MTNRILIRLISFAALLLSAHVHGQSLKWAADGSRYWHTEAGEIVQYQLPANTRTVILAHQKLIPAAATAAIPVRDFLLSADEKKVLVYTNTKKVWRLDTRGDYWVYSTVDGRLTQAGAGLPASSLMFAKFSPDSKKLAYVSNNNIYAEDLATGKITPLTKDGSKRVINGTFDWAYEEEFFCRDGFRWSPDSKSIAYWQINARVTGVYDMINTTDSIYPRVIPVEYPVAGEAPSPFKIGIVPAAGGSTRWMDIPTDPVLQSYLPRMEWVPDNSAVIVQHLNRRQDASDLLLCSAATGKSTVIYHESDSAWIDIQPSWDEDYNYGGWDWLNKGNSFLWASEKDGWRHLYTVSRDGKKQQLVTTGNFDVMNISCVDEPGGYVYYMASPKNATQAYLYRSRLDGSAQPELLTPANEPGTHEYMVGPGAKYAYHIFSNYYTPYAAEWVSLPDHASMDHSNTVEAALAKADKQASGISFFTVKTADGTEMDGWMKKPRSFDSSKRYPVVFQVYTEPAAQTVKDEYGIAGNRLYRGDMAKDGYCYVSVDNRGTPAPKGRAWRKSIHKKIGLLNISDQAAAAREILKWKYMDSSRVAVWGWSGGGSATLNLMFQHPEIYKTGIAIAAVGNQLTYDNIYQERYMGLPQESRQDFINGSPITYARNLQGNLLYIHGTGDDNVHYANAEMLINELVKYNRQFQFMAYPNRTHSISEGAGTFLHLSTLYTQYLRAHCPPGPAAGL